MGATDEAFQIQALREAVRELLAAFHEFSPVLRRALLAEHHFDVEKWEQRLSEILPAPSAPGPVEQNELFAGRRDEHSFRNPRLVRQPARPLAALFPGALGAVHLLRVPALLHPFIDAALVLR